MTWTRQSYRRKWLCYGMRCLNQCTCRMGEAIEVIRSRYKEVTSNLMALAISANSAGINLQTETRNIFDTVNNLMGILGFPLR